MKYYSEITNKLYDTKEELIKVETQIKQEKEAKEAKETKLKAERAARAKGLNQAIEEANKAEAKAKKLFNDFLKDYGSYHTSFKFSNDKADAAKTKEDFNFLDIFNSVLSDFLA